MSQIKIEKNPSKETLEQMNINSWPIWEKEKSSFPWSYDSDETCYIIEGSVTVTDNEGHDHKINTGDLVTFSKGLSCQWTIHEDIKKHYSFS